MRKADVVAGARLRRGKRVWLVDRVVVPKHTDPTCYVDNRPWVVLVPEGDENMARCEVVYLRSLQRGAWGLA